MLHGPMPAKEETLGEESSERGLALDVLRDIQNMLTRTRCESLKTAIRLQCITRSVLQEGVFAVLPKGSDFSYICYIQ
jgi:predicted component of type VI protein secretion system